MVHSVICSSTQVSSLFQLIVFHLTEKVGYNVEKTVKVNGNSFKFKVNLICEKYGFLSINGNTVNFLFNKKDLSKETCLNDIEILLLDITYSYWSDPSKVQDLQFALRKLYNDSVI